jgi:hypothetical protein
MIQNNSQENLTIKIRKYGRNTGARNFEQRYLYLYIEPFDDGLESGINKAVDTLNKIMTIWRPPYRSGFFRPDMWWEHASCEYCRQRVEYEVRKWQHGERVWTRSMCLRHWFIHHLSMITPNEPTHLISNQPISIVADSALVTFVIETMNYKYNLRLTKEVAEMTVIYKGRTYKYRYRSHTRGHPYISSYMNILFDIHATMATFKDFLTDYVLKRRLYSNVIINDSITLSPAQPDTGCAVCQL